MADLTQADWERIIHPLIMDTHTREVKIATISTGPVHWWGDGGGSCDCNRAIAFTGTIYNLCGNARYVIVDIAERDEADDAEAIIRYVNELYIHRGRHETQQPSSAS